MNLGKILGSISPAFGMASGKGLFGNSDFMGSISPLMGMMSGQGLGGALGGMGGLGGMGLLQMLMGGGMGGQGGEEEEIPTAPLQGLGSDTGMARPTKSATPAQPSYNATPYDNYLTRFGGGLPYGLR